MAMATASKPAQINSASKRIRLDNFDAEILNEERPVLLSCVHRGDGFREQLAVIESVSEAYAGALKSCLLEDGLIAALEKRLGVRGTPTFLVLKEGIEIDRMLGKANRETLAAFLVRALPRLEGGHPNQKKGEFS